MNRAVLASLVVCTASLAEIERATAGTNAGAFAIVANSFSFAVDIPGCADASRNILDISIDDLIIDVREVPIGVDSDARLFEPGPLHIGQARFTFRTDDAMLNCDLDAWVAATRGGKQTPRDITITLFMNDQTTIGRTYTLENSFPVSFSSGDFTTGGEANVGELVVQPERVAFDGGDDPPKDAAPLNGFVVQTLVGGDAAMSTDGAWQRCAGAALVHELHPVNFGGTYEPGAAYFTELTLSGGMTGSRKSMARWLTAAASGKDPRATVRCARASGRRAEGGQGQTCSDVFIVGYTFPYLSVGNTTSQPIEEVRLKPIRCELK